MRRVLLPLLSALTLILIGMVVDQFPFANGPAEWEWTYRPLGLEPGAAVLAAIAAALIAWAVSRPRPKRSPPRTLAGLILLGLIFTFNLVAAQPEGLERVLRSLASRNSFGYVFDAGLAPPTRELLTDYPRATAGLNQHSRTHPPGPLLLVRGLDAVGDGLRPLLAGAGGLWDRAAEALEREAQRARDRRRPAPKEGEMPSPGALLLLALLLPGLSVLTAAPLHRLALDWGLPPRSGFLAAGLWLLVPARSLFTPSLDQALPFLLVAAAVLATPSRRGTWRPIAAGVLAALCTVVTYGYVVMLPLLAGLAAFESGEPGRIRLNLGRPVLLGVGFTLPWLALVLGGGFDFWPAFQIALAEHKQIAVVTRDYQTWLLWNPYDFALLLGPAVLGLAAAAAVPVRVPARTPVFRTGVWLWWGILLLLLFLGSVRGEVGRIWLMFMPFACLFAAEIVAGHEDGRKAGGWLALLQGALAMALAAAMVFVS
ncbi:MAG TPA: hypothetical protein VHN15_00095 [Thermoanaerobaculia bacterium]|nr:hypothetical protein [Thermoanaerobaculia bacterium]